MKVNPMDSVGKPPHFQYMKVNSLMVKWMVGDELSIKMDHTTKASGRKACMMVWVDWQQVL